MTRTLAAALVTSTLLLAAPAPARADDDDPSPNQEICGAYNLGVPPDQIPEDINRGDARWNYWRAQQRTRDTILGGDCG